MGEQSDVVRSQSGRLRTIAVTAVVVVLLAIGLQSVNLLPSLTNPFGTETKDRNNPVLLTSLTDLARFQAASGSFQVVLDTERDVSNVPSLVAGERTLFVATASVESYVDFAGLDDDAVTISADGNRVDIILPPAALSDVRVDPQESYVASRDRGVLNRLGGVFSDNPTSERDLYLAAERKIAQAAEASELQQRAEGNTRSMLTGLLGTLGYTEVQVQFTPDVRP